MLGREYVCKHTHPVQGISCMKLCNPAKCRVVRQEEDFDGSFNFTLENSFTYFFSSASLSLDMEFEQWEFSDFSSLSHSLEVKNCEREREKSSTTFSFLASTAVWTRFSFISLKKLHDCCCCAWLRNTQQEKKKRIFPLQIVFRRFFSLLLISTFPPLLLLLRCCDNLCARLSSHWTCFLHSTLINVRSRRLSVEMQEQKKFFFVEKLSDDWVTSAHN